MSTFADYERYDGLGLAELVRTREVAPTELVEAAIERIERRNPQLNAVVETIYDQARQQARQTLPTDPFQGVPFLLKDLLVHAAGVPLRCGSRFLDGFVPQYDSELVRRYRAAGTVLLGTTNAPEFGLNTVTEPELYGPAHNPWNLEHTTGGSSGGSAAAVAARLVPVAHGNDGGGSIRVPAACCGVFGLKPSRGRNPVGPDMAEGWHGLSCDHVLSRSVRDSAAMLDATHGLDVGAPYGAPTPQRPFLAEVDTDPGRLRIAFSTTSLLSTPIHQDCIQAVEAAAALCQDLGHEVSEASPPIDGQQLARALLVLISVETQAAIEEFCAVLGKRPAAQDFEPTTWALALLGQTFRAPEFSQAVHLVKNTGRQVGAFMRDYDVLLSPVLSMPPPPIGAFQPSGFMALGMTLLRAIPSGGLLRAAVRLDDLAEMAFAFAPFTPLYNATGQPAMSVPLFWNEEGLPLGIQFAGRYGQEDILFRLAGQLERAQPWHDRRPPASGL